MSTVFSDNVTKYNNFTNAGGSISNAIPDGYVRTVEQVWLDSYTIAFTSTKVTLDLAVLPLNKKLTGVEVLIETSASQTNGSLALGWSEDSAYGAIMAPTSVSHNLTATSICFPGVLLNNLNTAAGRGKIGAFQTVTTGTRTTVTLQINNWTMTTGTIKSIVRYT